ncbi:MAG: nicotinamide-nucleotide adenylyltransferase [Candidatus Thorarchaeota archaeon]|nr:nicotinamide-nucleotide adenylyltransferase [Candidatus Thorarchaeota archaeon]
MRAVFVGRFQPIHNGHLSTIKQIIDSGEELVIAVGSAQYSHTPDNPFSGGERIMLIKRALLDEGLPLDRIDIVPVPDIHIHPLWVAHLKSFVPYFEKAYTHNPLVRKLFIDAGFEVGETHLLSRDTHSGKHVRDLIREGGEWQPLVPPGVVELIKRYGLDERMRAIGKVTLKR